MGSEKGGEKLPWVRHRDKSGPQMVLTMQPHHCGGGYNSRPIAPNLCIPWVLLCQTYIYVHGVESHPQKSGPPESGNRRHCLRIAIEYYYKLSRKMCLNFITN